ncbi:MAG: EAL domain-containing protein [Methylococcales bacterium]|nr:EAL domain-containing protein [Methylococcales bacterium]
MSKGYKILIIDDDPTLCMIAERKLKQYGYSVLTALTGKEGIQYAVQHSPDILLLDYELPDMAGIDVCRYLRKNRIGEDKPILFIAGKEDYQSIENAFQAGATDFSSKPLNWSILVYRIQYMLRAHEINVSLISSEARLAKAQKIAKLTNWEYNAIDKSFKWSDTIYDLLEVNPQHENNLQLSDFYKRVPETDLYKVQQAISNCIGKNSSFDLEHALITQAGNHRIISHLGNVIKNDMTNIVEYIGTLQDITERRSTEDQVRTLAYYDSLTGLMNRESFLTGLDAVISSNKKYDLLSALLFIDLDDFKRVNDTLGHELGDLLLCEIAERLTNCVRTAGEEKEYQPNNHRLIKNPLPDGVVRLNSIDIQRFDLARLGGDEFTIFLADIPNIEVAASVSARLLKALEKPFSLDGYEVYVTFSIGIAISPTDGENIQVLLKNADTAMYSAKSNGKNNYQFYSSDMNEKALDRLSLESDLRNAIANNELHLVYQPQICLQTGCLVGAEALMRWTHSEKGNISPVEFIPLAEVTGQILVIGDWLFEQFNKDLVRWSKQGLIPEKFKLALNVSSLQFHQSNMMEKVEAVFSDLELNKHIEFELTESVMMQNAESNLDKLNQLAERNITLSIDDFGTGYSSLSYLHQFPVDTLKIDRSFISNMEGDGQIVIVNAILAMAKGMNITVVAEGIENQWQYDFLKQAGCDIGQGYFISKPIMIDTFEELLQNEKVSKGSLLS